MIMVLNRYNNVVYLNPEHITRIEPSGSLCRIYMVDGKNFESNTDIEVIIKMIKDARGEQ
jgi:uncharacterized protein YlzI (FlbEa/FlbD family)